MAWTLIKGRCRHCRGSDGANNLNPNNASLCSYHEADDDDDWDDEDWTDYGCCLCHGCEFDSLVVEIHCSGEGCPNTQTHDFDPETGELQGIYSLGDISLLLQENEIAETYLCDECRDSESSVSEEKVDFDESKGSTEKTNCEKCDNQVEYIRIGLHMKYICDNCGYDASFDSTGEGDENEPEHFGDLYYCHICNVDSFTEDRFDMEEEMCKDCVRQRLNSHFDEFDEEW